MRSLPASVIAASGIGSAAGRARQEPAQPYPAAIIVASTRQATWLQAASEAEV
jgi:hypothetical protein